MQISSNRVFLEFTWQEAQGLHINLVAAAPQINNTHPSSKEWTLPHPPPIHRAQK